MRASSPAERPARSTTRTLRAGDERADDDAARFTVHAEPAERIGVLRREDRGDVGRAERLWQRHESADTRSKRAHLSTGRASPSTFASEAAGAARDRLPARLLGARQRRIGLARLERRLAAQRVEAGEPLGIDRRAPRSRVPARDGNRGRQVARSRHRRRRWPRRCPPPRRRDRTRIPGVSMTAVRRRARAACAA